VATPDQHFRTACCTRGKTTRRPFPHCGKRRLIERTAITRLELTGVQQVQDVLVFAKLLFPALSPRGCHRSMGPSLIVFSSYLEK